MPKVSLSILLFLFKLSFAISQIEIDLSFTASFEGDHKAIDSIIIINLTEKVDTVIYGSDTVFNLHYNDISTPGFSGNLFDNPVLYNNYPNPFTDNTSFKIYTPSNKRVALRVFDISGKELSVFSGELETGIHKFTFHSCKAGTYFLSLEADGIIQTNKLLALQNFSGHCRIDHHGTFSTDKRSRKSKSSFFKWVPGDKLRFFIFAKINSEINGHYVFDTVPSHTTTYNIKLIPGKPCMDEPFVNDIDGNRYRTIKIGNQCWMLENLRTTRYSDGIVIPEITDNNLWSSYSNGAYCWYNNDSANKNIFGGLYNWHAIENGNLCPYGWFVPGDTEWNILTNYVGGNAFAGGHLKQRGTSIWHFPNTAATNVYGFTALPGGLRNNINGSFESKKYYGYWWTSTDIDQTQEAWVRLMYYNNSSTFSIYSNKKTGMSIRCIRNY